jgi:shikimate kinase
MVIGLPASYRNLIVTGYGASNHPRLVSQMASSLKRPFVDVEALIEQRLGESMEETRQMYGERHMKANIAEVMSNVLLYRGTVIRIHGSTLASGDYLARMQETGIVVCLVARLDAILQKMHLSLGARYHDPRERAMEWAVRKLPGVMELDVTERDEAGTLQDVIALWQTVALERS